MEGYVDNSLSNLHGKATASVPICTLLHDDHINLKLVSKANMLQPVTATSDGKRCDRYDMIDMIFGTA